MKHQGAFFSPGHQLPVDLVGSEDFFPFCRLRLFAHRNPDIRIKDIRSSRCLQRILRPTYIPPDGHRPELFRSPTDKLEIENLRRFGP